jgi:hypothetical protein
LKVARKVTLKAEVLEEESVVGGSSSKCVELVLGVTVTYLSSSDGFSEAEFCVRSFLQFCSFCSFLQ